MKTFFTIIGVIVLLIGASFAGNALGLFNIKFWGVKFQDARTEVFEQTKAHKHGTIKDIQNFCIEIAGAESEEHRVILRATLRDRIAAFPREDLPNHLNDCLGSL